MADVDFRFKVMWGQMCNGVWFPNPNLAMSEDEQFRQNVENGFDMFPVIPRPGPINIS